MKACYELKNPRKNPYAERMKNGYTIIIDRSPDKDETEPIRQGREEIRRGEVVSEDDINWD